MHRRYSCFSCDEENCLISYIKKFLKHIIYTNVVVAFSTGVLCAGYSYSIGTPKWPLYGMFAFLSTMAVYNGQRLFKSNQKKKTPWLQWVKRNEKYLFLLVVLFSLAAFLILILIQNLEVSSMFVLAGSGVISLFYVIKIAGRNMREIPYVKIHLISISWVMILIVFPAINEGIDNSLIWIAIAHYCYVLGVTIPFDIRDLKYDLSTQKTIPQVLGVSNARVLALFLIVAFAVIMLYVNHGLWWNGLFYLGVLTQIFLVLFMNEDRSDIYCAGWIDGAITLLGLSYFY